MGFKSGTSRSSTMEEKKVINPELWARLKDELVLICPQGFFKIKKRPWYELVALENARNKMKVILIIALILVAIPIVPIVVVVILVAWLIFNLPFMLLMLPIGVIDLVFRAVIWLLGKAKKTTFCAEIISQTHRTFITPFEALVNSEQLINISIFVNLVLWLIMLYGPFQPLREIVGL